MTKTETTWGRFLQIKTTGRDDSHANRFHHPYEPTPYSVLERLANKGFIGKRDVVLDYGCGDLFAGNVPRERIMIFLLA